MLKDKKELELYLEKRCEHIVFIKEISNKIMNYMYEKYAIPMGTTMDMIAQRISLSEKTEFELFCLLDAINIVDNDDKNKKIKEDYLSSYFTDLEITSYKKQKMESNKIKFPIRIGCMQVSENQWIGATNSKFFMDLRESQLLKYNVNAQRVMKRIIKGATILFKIMPNKLAINAIKLLMKQGMYIPTVITLNLPYDSDAEFYYDSKEKELVIKSLDAFDISDGYQRYLAMCELSDEDPDFTYPMEIRIINFSDEKTRQFIFQEDQKTKMAQSDSRTMNINRPSNNVIDRLNETSGFDFKGQIGRNEGTISYGILSDVIEYFYFKAKKNYTNVDVINAAKDVKEKLNALASYNPHYITRPLNLKELATIFYAFNKQDTIEACQTIDRVLNSGELIKLKYYNMSKPLINAIDKLI
jgi:hypothetical protein